MLVLVVSSLLAVLWRPLDAVRIFVLLPWLWEFCVHPVSPGLQFDACLVGFPRGVCGCYCFLSSPGALSTA